MQWPPIQRHVEFVLNFLDRYIHNLIRRHVGKAHVRDKAWRSDSKFLWMLALRNLVVGVICVTDLGEQNVRDIIVIVNQPELKLIDKSVCSMCCAIQDLKPVNNESPAK